MSHLFFANIETSVKIEGCPESGLAALDWRRSRGLSERLDDRVPVKLVGEISEGDFRRLVAAGWHARSGSHGEQEIESRVSMPHGTPQDSYTGDGRWQPAHSYGWRATVPVSPGSTDVDLLCAAATVARRRAARAACGAEKLEERAAELRAELRTIESRLAECEVV